jgi:DNA polymerase-3 subunit gamma/tau
MIDDLEVKHRPHDLVDVIGQDHITKPIMASFKHKKMAHKYLFHGPKGLGKTTIARIVGSMVGCTNNNIIEMDAASNNGVDYMKTLINSLMYTSLGKIPTKMVIIDECHALSVPAWNALHKTLEEPPRHVYIALCTTEYQKVPETIKSRCRKYMLKEVSYKELLGLVKEIAESEEIELEEDSLKLITRNAAGCPREALVCLDQCRYCEDKEEVTKVLSTYVSSNEVIDLCRLVAGNIPSNFKTVQKILDNLKDKNPESVRIVVSAYLSKCVISATSKDQMLFFYKRLNEFNKPILGNQSFNEIILNTISSLYE